MAHFRESKKVLDDVTGMWLDNDMSNTATHHIAATNLTDGDVILTADGRMLVESTVRYTDMVVATLHTGIREFFPVAAKVLVEA